MTTRKHTGLILLGPHITEKGSYLASLGVYVFSIVKTANKREVLEAVEEIYKVRPRKVRILTMPRTRVKTRGTNRPGFTGGGKKAYVYLKEGDTIEFV